MRRYLALSAILVFCAVAAGQDVKYVQVAAEDPLDMSTLATAEFTKPAEGSGTTHAAAVVASFQNSKVRAAVDCAKADAKTPDTIRIDFAGEGKFDAKNSVPLTIQSAEGKDMTGEFGPTVLQVPVGGKPVPVLVRGSYIKRGADRVLYLQLISGVEAVCSFGGKGLKVRFLDGTNNLKYGDSAPATRAFTQSDTVAVDTGDGSFTKGVRRFLYGQPVIVDGKAYQVALSADGAKATAEPLDIPLGQIKIKPGTVLKMLGGKYACILQGAESGAVDVPAGDYAASTVTIRPDPKGKALAMISAASEKASKISVAAGKTTEPAFGEPLKGVVETRKLDDGIGISLSLTDSADNRVVSLMNDKGERPPPPTVIISDSAGKEVAKVELGYG